MSEQDILHLLLHRSRDFSAKISPLAVNQHASVFWVKGNNSQHQEGVVPCISNNNKKTTTYSSSTANNVCVLNHMPLNKIIT